MSRTQTPRSIDTVAVHEGTHHESGAVVTPIYQSAMYLFGVGGAPEDVQYIRYGNTPNHRALETKLAALEGTEAALVTGSGMGAIGTGLLSVLRSGDRLMATDSLYGGTHKLLTVDLPELGIETDFVSGDDASSWSAALRPETKAFYTEPITNPLVRVPDVRGVARFARERGLTSMIDSTFATPVNFRPALLEDSDGSPLGYDMVFHSATKFLGGHSDLVAGVICASADRIERARSKAKAFGHAIDPHTCFLLDRGVKTLGVRVRRQGESALAIAQALESIEGVDRVFYPGLESDENHARASGLFDGFGGMIAFELRDSESVRCFLESLRVVLPASSLGGVESVASCPPAASHAEMPRDQRLAVGIRDGLVRLSVGLEEPADLIEDLRQAIEAS